MPSPLSILWFAWLRDRVGVAEEMIEPPEGVRTVSDLITWLGGLDLRHAAAFANRETVRCAVNQEFAGPMTPIHPGDEVAFFPPVTGG